MIVAICTREQQLERAMERDGATIENVMAVWHDKCPL